MSTSPESIAVGLYYLTTAQQVRKVLAFDGDWVTYVAREGMWVPGWETGSPLQTTRRKFAREVVRCGHDRDLDHRTSRKTAAQP